MAPPSLAMLKDDSSPELTARLQEEWVFQKIL